MRQNFNFDADSTEPILRGTKKKKLSLGSLKCLEEAEQTKYEPVQKISDNGSLVLSHFRLNSDGIKFTNKKNSELLLSASQVQMQFLGSKYIKNMKLEEFEVIQRLGQGKFGQVDKVIHKPTQEYYALKKIHFVSDDVQESFLKKELIALVDCDSPYIVRCYGAFYSRGEIFILLEYMDMGSLETIINKVGRIIESILMIITNQVLKGINYLHDVKKIIHRDIKPHNILINKKGEVKIADFGICSIQNKSSEKFQTFIGTITYMSPERMNGEEYGMDSDIWSIGVMLIQCFTGKHPLEYNPKKMALIEYVNLVKKFSASDNIQNWTSSKYTKEFIISCLKQVPEERAKASELLEYKAVKLTQSLSMEVFKNWLDMVFEDV